MTSKSLIPGVVALCALPAAGQVQIFDNAGGFYSFTDGWSVGNGVETAMAFTTPPGGANWGLTQIDIALTSGFGGATPVVLSLERASSAGLPDNRPIEIGTLDTENLPPFGTVNNVLETVKPVKPVSMVSGAEYWLVASSGSATWNGNCLLGFDFAISAHCIGEIGPVTENLGNGWLVVDPLPPGGLAAGAFKVFAERGLVGVPEPATLGLMALGLLGAGFAGRKRRS
jgi:hypothetical protein